MRPGDLYQRTKALECYLDGNPDAWLAADVYGPWLTQLRGMGVRETVRLDARAADELGYVSIADEFAWHERGVAGFDPSATDRRAGVRAQEPQSVLARNSSGTRCLFPAGT